MGWSGDATGSVNPLNLTIERDMNVGAIFINEAHFVSRAGYDAVVAERDALQNEKSALIGQVSTLTETVAARDASIVTLQGEKTALASQVTTLTERVAARDDTIGELSQRPTQASYDAVVAERDTAITERDTRPTLDQLEDARVGSIVVKKNWQSGQVSLSLGLEKTEDGVSWTAYEGGTWHETPGGKFTLSFPLTETKNWVRLALKDQSP